MQILLLESNPTLFGIDWLAISQFTSVISALGVVVSVIWLIINDYQKGKRIDNLAGIATESKKQTDQLIFQNDILAKHNDIQKNIASLISQQVDIMRDKLFQNENREGVDKLLEIEEKKLRLSLLPVFTWHFGGGGQEQISIHFMNTGETAVIESVKEIDSKGIFIFGVRTPLRVEKNTEFQIGVKGASIQQLEYRLELIYHDKAENRYRQILDCKGSVARFNSKAELLEAE